VGGDPRVLSESGPSISDEDVFDALCTINEQTGKRRRSLTRDEVRQALADLRTPNNE
jgi:hypothetical protein